MAAGADGRALNVFSTVPKKWHRTYGDDRGNLLVAEGEYKDGAIQLSADGKRLRVQLNVFNEAPGKMRQTWQQSADDGKTWGGFSEYTYVRKGAPPA
jgi:hypothetical protein